MVWVCAATCGEAVGGRMYDPGGCVGGVLGGERDETTCLADMDRAPVRRRDVGCAAGAGGSAPAGDEGAGAQRVTRGH